MHDWPAWLKPATAIFVAAATRSPSGSRITGALFPSSRPTFLRGALALDAPADLGRAGERDHGDVVVVDERVPTVPPLPVTTFSRPGGSPHSSSSSSASAIAESGVCDAGFRTTGQPAAIAGAILWATRFSGKLNGLIAPTTPIGTRRVKPSFPAPASLRVHGDHLAGERARLDRCGEREGRHGAGGLDPGRLDRLRRLGRDDPGEGFVALSEQPRRRVEDLRPTPRGEPLAGARGLRRLHGASTSAGPPSGTRASSFPS